MSFGPKKLNFSDIFINSLWSFIAWIIWSIIIVIITFFAWNIIDVPWTFKQTEIWANTNSIFPLFLSIITFIWTNVSTFLTYFLLSMTSPEKYKRNIIILRQIAFFSILIYAFITPIYIYTWLQNYENIIFVFLVHILILAFWTSIILELLNNYRYILTWFYWSFVSLFFSGMIAILFFSSFSEWYAKLIILVLLLPIINFSSTFFKQIFEFLYFYYNKYTNLDQLWDIFYQIENEEKETLREEENSI